MIVRRFHSVLGIGVVPGQGYIWMVHKSPESDTWELTKRSHKLWEMLAEGISYQGLSPLEVLGWKKTGIFKTLVSKLSYCCSLISYLMLCLIL